MEDLVEAASIASKESNKESKISLGEQVSRKLDFYKEAGKLVLQLPGALIHNVEIPDNAKGCTVYFVTDMKYDNYYVGGYYLTEKNNIINHVKRSYKYVIFLPHDTRELGIKNIACGDPYYAQYKGLNREQILSVRNETPLFYYITEQKDVEYLKLRMKTIGVGKVYSYEELAPILDEYADVSAHLKLSYEDAMYQALVDIAISTTL